MHLNLGVPKINQRAIDAATLMARGAEWVLFRRDLYRVAQARRGPHHLVTKTAVRCTLRVIFNAPPDLHEMMPVHTAATQTDCNAAQKRADTPNVASTVRETPVVTLGGRDFLDNQYPSREIHPAV